MLPAKERLPGVQRLIDDGQFFVIHAARQTGKTTLLKDLTRTINAGSDYHALYCSLESVQGISDMERGIPAIVRCLAGAFEQHPTLGSTPFAVGADFTDFNNVLRKSLSRCCASLDRPLILFLDEADCLSDSTLICFLRQLREGYVNRADAPFVQSLALVGMRNIRDYKAQIRDDSRTLGSASPFNIATKAMTIENFTRDEIAELYAQHQADTGQAFPGAVVDKVSWLTSGQPWLVNAIAREIVVEILADDHARLIDPGMAQQAAQTIILRRDTHIDSLLERLKEERVRRIVEPMILGKAQAIDRLDDDFAYCLDLGLVTLADASLEPANPIYGEVIVRTLSYNAQMDIGETRTPPALGRFLRPDGLLDMDKMLCEFQEFWRRNAEIWVERFQYKEAASHLILMAFLQRVLNGGGRILREMATGRRRLDLCVELDGQSYPVELKIDYGPETINDGAAQLGAYMDTLGAPAGWLVVFDRDPAKPWDAKIFRRAAASPSGKPITIFGC